MLSPLEPSWPRFHVGDRVRLWKRGAYEHGMRAVVRAVITIEAYYHAEILDASARLRGPHAYLPLDGWWDEHGVWFCGGALPDAMVVSEQDYQLWRVAHPDEWQARP